MGVKLGLNLIEGIKEPLRRNGRTHQQDAEDIPAEHMPPGGVGALNAHVYGFSLQFFRDPGHPDERIDERRRDSQQVRDPVPLGPPAENLVKLLLQAAERHVQQEEQPGREEIDETEPEPGSVCVLEPHGRSDLSDEIRLTVAIWCRISENSPDRDSSRPCVMSFMMNSSFRGAEISSKYSLAISQLVW